MKTDAVGRAASPLAAVGAHGVTRPTLLRDEPYPGEAQPPLGETGAASP